MKLPSNRLDCRRDLDFQPVGSGLTPSQYETMDLECSDCKITCESLRDPKAVEECLESCNRPDGPCGYLKDLPME